MIDIFLSGLRVYTDFLTAYVALSGSSYLSWRSFDPHELPALFQFKLEETTYLLSIEI